MRIIVSFFSMLLGIVFLGNAQDSLSTFDQAFYEGWRKFDSRSGVAIGIMQDGEVLYQGGFGKRHLDSSAVINELSIFPVASISKAFTATLIAKMMEDSDITWNTPVKSVWPAFDLYDNYVESVFTFKDLLNHRNGYKTFDGDILWYGTKYSPQEALKRFAKLPPNQNFRDEYGYQNTMFMVAALVIEDFYKMSWSQAVNRHILEPLGMVHTTTNFQDHLSSKHLVYPVMQDRSFELTNYDNAVGAVGVNSNVVDLLRWADFWVDEEDEAVISQASKSFLIRMHLVQGENEKDGLSYNGVGLGWFIGEKGQTKTVSHSGGLPGFIHHLVMVPEHDFVAVALSNGTNYIPFAATSYAMDILLQGTSPDYFLKYAQRNREIAEKEAKHVKDLLAKSPFNRVVKSEYLGTFTDPIYGKASVEKKNGILFLKFLFADKWFEGYLVPQRNNQFIWEHSDPFMPKGRILFERDFENQVTGFKVDIYNHDFHYGNMQFQKD